MWSRLERWAAFVVLAAFLLLGPVAGVAQGANTQVLIDNSFSKGNVRLNKKDNQTYRLLFQPDSRFVDGKISGILLLQGPKLQWQAFVSVRGRGCFALSKLDSYTSPTAIERALGQLQPLSGNWLPDNPGAFAGIIEDNRDAFGTLQEAADGAQGLPASAVNQAALAKVVLRDCESPEAIAPDELAARLDGPATVKAGVTAEEEAAAEADLQAANAAAAADATARQQQSTNATKAAQDAEEFQKRAETAVGAIESALTTRRAEADTTENAARNAAQAATEAAAAAKTAAERAAAATDTATAAAAANEARDAANKAKTAAETAEQAQRSLATPPPGDSANTGELEEQLKDARSRISALEANEPTLTARLEQSKNPATGAAILSAQSNAALEASRTDLSDTEQRLQQLAKQSNDLWSELQDKLGPFAESKDRDQLIAWVTKTKPTLIDFPRATPAATAVGNGGDSDQRNARDQIRRISTASQRNWQELGTRVAMFQNEHDRTALRAWIDSKKPDRGDAFGPVANRIDAPDNAFAFDPLWHLYAILAALLLASLASLWFLWQLKRNQDQMPRQLASDPDFKRMLQQAVAPEQLRQELAGGFNRMRVAGSAWLDKFLNQRSEFFDSPMTSALETMGQWQGYETKDDLAAGGDARRQGLAPRKDNLGKLAGNSRETITKRKEQLEAALAEAEKNSKESAGMRSAGSDALPADTAKIIAGQAIALPLAAAFQTVTERQAELLRHVFARVTEQDDTISHLIEHNKHQKSELEKAQALSNAYQAFTVGRLRETGFLGAADPTSDADQLKQAMDRFDNDIEHFPEHLDYASRLIGLRSHLSEDRVQTLPYYGTAGLAELREKLAIRKGDWQSLFHGTEQKVAETLVGQWSGILRHLFRSRLLLQTYWPERTDPDLAFHLERAHAAVELVLHKHAIHPHPVQLLKPLAEVERPPKIIADDTRPLPPALANSPELNDAMNRLQYEQNTKVVVDVAYWGVDCEVSVPEETTRTLLITRSGRGGTSQS